MPRTRPCLHQGDSAPRTGASQCTTASSSWNSRGNRNTAWSRQMRIDMICEANDIKHRLTIDRKHPWTNGQVERMNRTIKLATVKRFQYESHEQIRTHLADFIDAYNFAPSAQGAQRFHALRIHRQNLHFRARPVHRQPNPPDDATKYLGCLRGHDMATLRAEVCAE